MPGTWTTSKHRNTSIHTYTAPEEGWLVTSHIIEFTSQLFIVDAQYTMTYAREVAKFANGLRKPVTRLYVTHYHPDHLLGAAAFDAPIYALRSVADKIALAGDRVAREEHEKVGDDIPDHSRKVDVIVEIGEQTVDGSTIVHKLLKSAETEDALVVALPDASAIIVQDLVYNSSHPFLGEHAFESWKAALREYRALPYDIVLPGHGVPGGKDLYDQTLDYLEFAEGALSDSKSAAEFRAKLVDRFPDYQVLKVLDHQMRFLFR